MPAAGTPMNYSLAFEPLLSWTLLGLVLAPMAVLALAGLFLRRRGAALRFVALLALAVVVLAVAWNR